MNSQKSTLLIVADICGIGISSGYVFQGKYYRVISEEYPEDRVNDGSRFINEFVLPHLEEMISKTIQYIESDDIMLYDIEINGSLLPIGVSISGQIDHNGVLSSASSIIGERLSKPLNILKRLQQTFKGHYIFALNNISAAAFLYGTLEEMTDKRFLVFHVGKGVGSKVFDGETYNVLLDHKRFSGEIGHVKVNGQICGVGYDVMCECRSWNHLSGYILKKGLSRLIELLDKQSVDEEQVLAYLLAHDETRETVLKTVADCICQAIVPVILSIGIDCVILKGSLYYSDSNTFSSSLKKVLQEAIKGYVEPYYPISDDFLVNCIQDSEKDREVSLLGLYYYYLNVLEKAEGVFYGIVSGKQNINVSISRKTAYSIIRVDTIYNAKDVLHGYLGDRKALIVIDNTLIKLSADYGSQLGQVFEGLDFSVLVLDASENGSEKKDIDSINKVIGKAVEVGLSRDGVLIAIGGGVVLDIVGFAAQQYRRKISYYRIPTTLVGQIDAGIGIKVGMNYLENKNLLGSFYPPELVINCSDFLFTLDEDNFACGISEILKAGIADCPEIINKLYKHEERFTSASIKEKQADFNEFETIMDLAIQTMLTNLHSNIYEEKELRRLMDFGHTFSPVIEGLSKYRIPHGYAVAIDMAISIYIAHWYKLITENICDIYCSLLSRYRLLKCFSECIRWEDAVFDLAVEKTLLHRAGNLNLVIPVGYGKSGFLNLHDCKDVSNEHYSIVVDRESFKCAFFNAIDELRNSNILI